MSDRSAKDRSLTEWVDYIQTLHHREIELSLERVRSVYRRLYPDGFKPKVITIAGTNGKGSCAAIVSSVYGNAGYKVGKFTSPHLIDFSERFLINDQAVSDAELLDAFQKIENARADTAITFFEFGALLAIELFGAADVDVAVMEVGLGGRLDAINILDADVAIISSISKDHTAWLGNTLEQIAYEKAGIARPDKPCVIGIREPQQSILDHCQTIGSTVYHLGREFDYACKDDTHKNNVTPSWRWESESERLRGLPLPFKQSGVQLSNAAVCVQVVKLLSGALPVSQDALCAGLQNATILARCQVLSDKPLVILDVAHNHSSVTRLRSFINQQRVGGRLIAVCGMLKDKEVQ